MCHMPRTKIFKKLKILIFFKKGAPEAKKMKILKKKISKSKQALKIGYKTCATCPE